MHINENERKNIMAEASRAGITKETVGEWLNLARRYERLNNFLEAANCARKAIQIHEVWGSRLNSYSMNEATLQRAKSIVAKGA